MPKTAKKKRPLLTRAAAIEAERGAAKRALLHSLRTEKLIQRLAGQLERSVQKTNSRLQQLAVSLGSYARALETGHDVDHSLAPK